MYLFRAPRTLYLHTCEHWVVMMVVSPVEFWNLLCQKIEQSRELRVTKFTTIIDHKVCINNTYIGLASDTGVTGEKNGNFSKKFIKL